jgi:hypothetical protein
VKTALCCWGVGVVSFSVFHFRFGCTYSSCAVVRNNRITIADPKGWGDHRSIGRLSARVRLEYLGRRRQGFFCMLDDVNGCVASIEISLMSAVEQNAISVSSVKPII